MRRDGSVFSAITLEDLANPDLMYRNLGCKMAVGMPFKDIASSDTVFMRKVPPADDASARKALRRLQEVGMHVMVPIAVLAATPLPNAVPVVPLRDAIAGSYTMPEGAKRCAPFLGFFSSHCLF